MRKFFTTVLFLITFPAFAYGPMIASDGITTAPAPDQGNNYGPMIISDGLAHGPMIVNDGLAHGLMIVIHG